MILSNSIPAVLFLSEAHYFEHFALKPPKTIEQVGQKMLMLERKISKLVQKYSS